MQSKIDFRIRAKSIRKSLDITNLSNRIIANIHNTHIYKMAKNIMIYYPLADEINLLDLLDDDKSFYLPRVTNDNLECCPYKKGDTLKLSTLKILEPISKPIDKSVIELIFVPALMADNQYNRLGYGGGFYDKFLKDINATKIIPIADELIVDKLPVENTDIKCNGFITQKKASFERG